MTRHDEDIRLLHMLDHAVEAVNLAQGRRLADIETDRVFALAMLKVVEIIGEAASRVSPAIRDANPHVPWPQIIATRNRLIHGYDQINYRILWDIVQHDLPPLIEQLRAMLKIADP